MPNALQDRFALWLLGFFTKTTEEVLELKSGIDLRGGSNRITQIADPVEAQDAATKHYVDNISIPVVKRFTHVQGGSLSTWTINHNFGQNPSGIAVKNSANEEVFGRVSFPTPNQLVIQFAAPMAGEAYLSA